MISLPLLLLVALALLVPAIAVLTWTVLTWPRVDTALLANLRRGIGFQSGGGNEPSDRAAVVAALARRLTPSRQLTVLDGLWSRAGRPAAWPVPRLIVAKLVLPLLAAGLGLLFFGARPGPLLGGMFGLAVVVCYFLPELLLYSRAQERSQKITLELADTLDQMTIAVEAGLGFDAAMAKAGHNGNGPLAEELVRTLQDIQLGQSRRAAYEGLAGRTDVTDLRRFVRSIIQADRYGVAVADVLRTQAAEMRMKRRQRAEEKAMQIPVKVIFPLMLCILPVLFIVLLGPAVMDIMNTFG
jgi:tight adherence protein C